MAKQKGLPMGAFQRDISDASSHNQLAIAIELNGSTSYAEYVKEIARHQPNREVHFRRILERLGNVNGQALQVDEDAKDEFIRKALDAAWGLCAQNLMRPGTYKTNFSALVANDLVFTLTEAGREHVGDVDRDHARYRKYGSEPTS